MQNVHVHVHAYVSNCSTCQCQTLLLLTPGDMGHDTSSKQAHAVDLRGSPSGLKICGGPGANDHLKLRRAP